MTESLCLGRMGVGNGAPEKVSPELNKYTCTAGYQPAAESMCLGRRGVDKRAPDKVRPELKTDTCTAGYQPATESLCLGRTCVGKGTPDRGYRNGRTSKKTSKTIRGSNE